MMIEQPAPPDFRWISPEMVGKIRAESRPLGAISILLSVLLIFPVVWVGNQLPASEHPMMGFVIIAGLGTNLCLFLSGIGVLNGPKCVQSGYLDVNRAQRIRSLVLAMGLVGLVLSVFSDGLLALLTTDQGPFDVVTGLYMSFGVIMLIVAATNYYVIRRLRATTPGPTPGPGRRW
jgi:hypothetical protein